MSKNLQENSSIEGGGSSNARAADMGGCTPFVTVKNNMETKYKSVVVYKSWIDTIKKLPIGEIDKFEAIMAILDYGFCGTETDHWAVDMVREQIDVNNKRRDNGHLGGRPKNQTETKPKPNRNQTETKPKPNNNLIDNSIIDNSIIENDNLKEKEKKESAGKPPRPTLEEIKEYVKEKKYTFDSEAFFNFYESNGWKVGKNPMKSWRAACVTWQKRHNEFNNNKNNNHGRNKNNNDRFSGTGYTGDTI